ncbi:OmpA family protein [Endozoicomonas ascidiicola]|uniref:OmpA family protein n=1 Tax=Endozoicomonas ascidiicola TaxID=1698521 RepID=UPI00082F609F|nr:OmpA family protein [Endozoicomonas ascidiicola]
MQPSSSLAIKVSHLPLLALMLLLGCSSNYRIDTYHQQLYDLQDSNYDGVVNVRDQCPITPKGSIVDNAGCPTWLAGDQQEESIIFFGNASAQLDTHQLEPLQKIAVYMRRHPNSRLSISGYASLPGSASYNLALSRERTERVRDTLIHGFQVNPDHITSHWYGNQSPIVAQTPSEGNQLNRRTTLLLSIKPQKPIKKWSAQTFSGPAFQ